MSNLPELRMSDSASSQGGAFLFIENLVYWIVSPIKLMAAAKEQELASQVCQDVYKSF